MLSRVASATFLSWRLAPSTARPTGTPRASVSRLRFVPSLPRSVGFRPVRSPPSGALVIAPSIASQDQSSPTNRPWGYGRRTDAGVEVAGATRSAPRGDRGFAIGRHGRDGRGISRRSGPWPWEDLLGR